MVAEAAALLLPCLGMPMSASNPRAAAQMSVLPFLRHSTCNLSHWQSKASNFQYIAPLYASTGQLRSRPLPPVANSRPKQSNMSKPDEHQIIHQVQSELSMAYLQEFYSTVRDKCFEKCVTKPSSSLGSSEQQCLARCCDRYAEATQVVMRSVLEQSGLGE